MNLELTKIDSLFKLFINEKPDYNPTSPLVIDVETDEKDNFVGIALTADGNYIHYITDLNNIKKELESVSLIGHNLKGDIKWLVNWGVNIKPEQLYYDTSLASYVQNTTKETQGLKNLAKEYLGLEWSTYKEMVGSGKKKQTLDKQPIEKVAQYCAMDCLATFRLYQYFQKKLNPQEKRYLETIELPTARVLLSMELKGVKVDIGQLNKLKYKFEQELINLSNLIHEYWNKQNNKDILNINSNKQIAILLQSLGAMLPKTPKGSLKVDKKTLEQYIDLPVVPLLLEYSKIEKLLGTYVLPFLEKNKNERIYCEFNQISRDPKGNSIGISTGRLSSRNPNLQNIPARTEEGKQIRQVFIPDANNTFIDSDYSQIEPRLVAHFSKDQLFLNTFKENKDIYQELVEGTGRTRDDGKTFMLALLYGAQPKKLASVFKCSELEASEIINSIMSKLPGVQAWINRTKYEARQKKGIWTLFKRWIPLPNINSENKYERLHWERVAVNSVIQGSAAEIMKLGLIKLKEKGFVPNLTVHDEYLIESSFKGEDLEMIAFTIKQILESITKLDVPLKVDIGIGSNWNEAKS